MKLATFSTSSADRIGVVVADGVVDVGKHVPGVPVAMRDLIAQWPAFGAKVAALAQRAADFPMSAVSLRPPVPEPRKIFAIGLNYADHIAESGLEMPKHQVWFSKAVTAVNGPFDDIELPTVSEQLDYECELVAVIGKRCRNVSKAQAREVIFGYCAGNDVSVRDWQLRSSQWVVGKSFDTHAPFGPWITTGDSIDPHALEIRCLVNGTVRQHSNTRHLVFDCFDQVEYLSKAVTLEPGDLLFTGTCGGVAAAHKPPVWLKVGDRVRVEIDGLGSIENRVKAGTSEMRLG